MMLASCTLVGLGALIVGFALCLRCLLVVICSRLLCFVLASDCAAAGAARTGWFYVCCYLMSPELICDVLFPLKAGGATN
jgi:hypothetical protein